MRDLLAFCDAERGWAIETLEALVAIESPSTDKAAADRCGAELARRLAAIGGRVDRLPRATVGDHVLAEFGCGESQVLLVGHFDTVWPVGQLARMPMRTIDGKFHGPGAFDMKAGLVIAMLAARALLEGERGSRQRIVFLATSDEEIGSLESRAVIEDEARRSDGVLVLEPALPGGVVKTRRKGVGDFRIEISGVAAHAGIDPGQGASAIHELARQIQRLEALTDRERGISVNVGCVEGGTRSNVVAERARASVDVRVSTLEDARRVEAAVLGLAPVDPRTQIRVDGAIDRPPMERTEGVARLFRLAREVAADLGFVLEEGSTGGASDGNFTAALGVPTLDGLGAIGDGAHALHEHVDLASLPMRAALVAGIIARLR